MLVSIAAGLETASARLEQDPYAAWAEALRRFRLEGLRDGPCDPARLEEYLSELPGDQRAEALEDLIAAHLTIAWQSGARIRLEAYAELYAARCPGLAIPANVSASLVEDEYLARHARPHGDAPPLEEYEQRFPRRADVMTQLRKRLLDGGSLVLLRRRGRGASGEVWEAHDRHAGAPVAVKLPRGGPTLEAALRRRFAEEARATAHLDHPGIASLREHRSSSSCAEPLFVLRLVDGPTLGERIRAHHERDAAGAAAARDGSWRVLLEAFASTCEAVAHAHAGRVLHLDLKPGNVLLDAERGQAVVIDWGACRRAGGERAHGPLAGTPDYMAPEQADGSGDERSDVFGLGAILHELLTGRPPRSWPGGSRPPHWRAIVREERVCAPRSRGPWCAGDLVAICRKALAHDPRDRYPGAADLAQDVRRHLSGLPVSARREPAWARLGRWLRARLAAPG